MVRRAGVRGAHETTVGRPEHAGNDGDSSVYLALKTLHIIAVVLFLGNIVTGLFWHRHAARTRDPHLLAHTMDGILRSDRIFTLPGVLGIILLGFALAGMGDFPILRTEWIAWTIVLFSISGIIFGMRVAPLQRRLRDVAREGARTNTFDYDRYHALARQWELWGAISLVLPFVGLALMVLKPEI